MELGAGGEPKFRLMSKIIEYLGYVSFECPADVIGKLKYFKLVNGLTFEKLGEAMGEEIRSS